MLRAHHHWAVPIVALLAASGTALAQDEAAAPETIAGLQIHAFASQGFLFTTENNYLAESDRGSFEFAEVGVNLTMPLSDRLRLGMQLFARDLGPIGDYRATVDWFSIDYHWQDWLGLRAGRIKVPFGLYNDSVDIDAAHTPALLPQSVYPAQNRDFLLAQTGGELYGYASLGVVGGLDYRVYGGTIFLDVEAEPGSPFTLRNLTVPYVAGGRLLWELPVDGLRLGGSLQLVKLESDLLIGMAPVSIELPAVLWVASADYIADELVVAAEYSRWHTDLESSDPMLIPEQEQVNERAYVMASYRVSPWLHPGAYYSLFYPDVDEREGRENKQHDVAATLRFDINLNWLVKVEAHYLYGTAALTPQLNDDQPLNTLDPRWALFLVKTTAYF